MRCDVMSVMTMKNMRVDTLMGVWNAWALFVLYSGRDNTIRTLLCKDFRLTFLLRFGLCNCDNQVWCCYKKTEEI